MKQWLRELLADLGLAEYLVPAFKFQCECGLTVLGPVPEEGTVIRLNCACGTKHVMYWAGDSWSYKRNPAGPQYAPSMCQGQEPDFDEALGKLLKGEKG